MPVLLENCDVPLRLRRFQYVDFTTVEFEEGIQKAKQLLETLMAQPSTPLVPVNPEPKPQKVPKKETTLAPELPNKNKPSQRRWVVSVAGIFLLAICFGVFATIFLLSNVIFPQTNQIQTQTSPVALTSNSSSPTSASPSSSQFALQSIFDNLRTDSWTTDFGKLTNPGAGGSGGGQGNGCLVWSEGVDGIANYYIAPSKYHGNWQVYSELRLDLWSSGGEYFDSEHEIHGDIYIVSGSATAHRLLPYRPPEQWETFVIPLVDDGQWIVGGGTTTLSDVLANVTDFQIRADYGTGDDTTGLDNVVLVPRLQE